MPHQCVRCSEIYDDGNEAILKGCKCGAKLFFYIRKDKLEQIRKNVDLQLSKQQKEDIEKDVFDVLEVDTETPVVLDFESIRILTPGKYELDLVKLFKNDAVIFKLEDGKYIIDVPETFHRMIKKTEEKALPYKGKK